MDVLRRSELVVGLGGMSLLVFGIIGNIDSLTVPGAAMVGVVVLAEVARAVLRRSNINAPPPPGDLP